MKSLRVVSGVIFDDQGRILVTERPLGKLEAGLWEFPGGKIEQDESEGAALQRELKEELQLDIDLLQRLGEFDHHFSWGHVNLAVYLGRAKSEAVPMEGQRIEWMVLDQIDIQKLVPADIPIVDAVRTALSKTSV